MRQFDTSKKEMIEIQIPERGGLVTAWSSPCDHLEPPASVQDLVGGEEKLGTMKGGEMTGDPHHQEGLGHLSRH